MKIKDPDQLRQCGGGTFSLFSALSYSLRQKAMKTSVKSALILHENVAWFFPAFWPWHGFSVPVVSYFRIVTAQESRAAPRSLKTIV